MAGSIKIVCMGHKESFPRAVVSLQYPRNLRTADICCVGSVSGLRISNGSHGFRGMVISPMDSSWIDYEWVGWRNYQAVGLGSRAFLWWRSLGWHLEVRSQKRRFLLLGKNPFVVGKEPVYVARGCSWCLLNRS